MISGGVVVTGREQVTQFPQRPAQTLQGPARSSCPALSVDATGFLFVLCEFTLRGYGELATKPAMENKVLQP